jgi:enterochelin esterase-like enzyme
MTMKKSPDHAQRIKASGWITLIVVLLLLDGGLAWVALHLTMLQPALPAQPTPAATATPVMTHRPTRVAATPSPVSTHRPTRTPRVRRTAIPTRVGQSPIAPPNLDPTTCAGASGLVSDEVFQSRTSGNEERYILYLPPCYDASDTRYPTLYLIHGVDYDASQWESLGVFSLMDEGINAKKWGPAIIILPEGDENLFTNTSGGPNSYEAQIVQELVPFVDSRFRTDPSPAMRAIGGISRGGVWSLEIGFLHPDMFSIIGGHSACLNLNEAPPALDPLKLVNLPSLKTQRIWLDTGDMDGCRDGVDALHDELGQAGVAHDYRLWSGVHDDALWASHLEDYLEFYTRTWPKPR